MKRQVFLLLPLSFFYVYSMQEKKYPLEHNLAVMAEMRNYKNVFLQYQPDTSQQEIQIMNKEIAAVREYNISQKDKEKALKLIGEKTKALHRQYGTK